MKKIYILILIVFIANTIHSQTPNVLRLKIVGSSTDETVIRIKTGSTFGFDGSYDAYKIISTLCPQIYTQISDGSLLSINAVSGFTTDYEFPLSIRVYYNGQYNINATGLLSFSSDLGIFLIDQTNGNIRNLKRDSLYTISANTTDKNERFLVHFSPRPSVPSNVSVVAGGSDKINMSITQNAMASSILVVYNSTGTFTTPIDGSDPGQAGSSFIGGTVLYKGPASGLTQHLGLNPGQHVFYKIYSISPINMYSAPILANATTFFPTLSSNLNVLNFDQTTINQVSSISTLMVNGTNLNAPIKIYSANGFQVSTYNGSIFAPQDSITLYPYNGTVNTPVYLRFAPTVATTYNGILTIKTNGTSNLTINMNGTGLAAQKNFMVKVFLQGMYHSSNGLMTEAINSTNGQPLYGAGICDKINIILHDANPPFSELAAFNEVNLLTDGTIEFSISPNYSGYYYIAVQHRNHLEIWSASAISFSGNTIFYDFTNQTGNAFQLPGFIPPQIEVTSGIYAMYAGDINQDGSIDNLDFNQLDPAITQGIVGVSAADLDGSQYVDSDDYSYFEPNMVLGPTIQSPY